MQVMHRLLQPQLHKHNNKQCSTEPSRNETAELLRELVWAASRPGSRRASETGLAPVESDLEGDLDDDEAFEHCLTSWEHTAYTKYINQCPEGGLFSLNQNPDVRATFSKKGSAS